MSLGKDAQRVNDDDDGDDDELFNSAISKACLAKTCKGGCLCDGSRSKAQLSSCVPLARSVTRP